MNCDYILPNFFESFSCNQVLMQEFLMTKSLYGVSGAFSFSIFNGGYNNNATTELVVYDDIVKVQKSYGPLNSFMLIDCSNIKLLQTDYNDCFNKIMFETMIDNPNMYFSIADLGLAAYLIKTYPSIQLVLDTNYTLFHTDKEIQNAIQEIGNNLKYIIISKNNLCTKINFNKIYKVFFTNCSICPQYKRCVERENDSVLEYSGISPLNSCTINTINPVDELSYEVKNALKHTNLVMFSSIDKNHEQECYTILEQVIKEN